MKFDFSKEPGRVEWNRDLVKTEKPLVSVVTPYYNASKYFEKLYPCVMNQTFPWFEWVIVDDGSNKEGEAEFLKQVEERDPRIRVVHKPNGGISSARNRGIKESASEIVITLDADELIEPTYFELLYWGLYYNPDAAWAYTDSVGFQNQEYVWQYPFDAEKLKTYNFLVESAGIRKKDLLEVGCYDEVEKHYFEDWRLWLKMLSNSKKPVHVESLEFWYRRTDTGVLSAINTDDDVKKRADYLISEVAKTADGSVEAKTFEGELPGECFFIPKRSDFDKPYRTEKKKKEILFLIPWMITGGADQFNLDFVRLLDKEKYNITIIATQNSENDWKQKFREYTSAIYSLPEFLDVKNYAEFISYIIQTRQIDVCLVSNSYYGYYLLPWLKAQYPEMAVIDYVHMEEMYWRKGGYARTSMAMSDLLEKTYVCNGATRRAFINQFGRSEDSVETLYIGVDQNKFDPSKTEYGTIRSEYKIPNQAKMVLFPCRLHGQKRPYLMVEIAKQVIAKRNDIYFMVVGDGDERVGMQRKINEYNLDKNVIFAGMQEDVRPFYKDSDLTLICSIREGLSLTAYESCSMMTPVITADVGGQKELIDETVGRVLPLMQREEDIKCTVYSEEEVKQYVDAILEILDEKNKTAYEQMCENCRKKVEDSFGLDTMIQKMESAIEDCFSGERKAKRAMLSTSMHALPYLSEDVLSMYLSYEGMLQENQRIWSDRCWFEMELRQTREELNRVREQKEFFEKECDGIWHSASFVIGRTITAVPRLCRGGVRCVQEHGLGYTLKHALHKVTK